MVAVPCALCGSDRSNVFFRQKDLTHRLTDEEFTIVRCTGCGFLFLNPRPTSSDIGRYYPTEYFGSPSPPRRFSVIRQWIREDWHGYPAGSRPGRWRWLRKLLVWPDMVRRVLTGRVILPWVGQGRLLDVGCGAGTSTAIFKAEGWDVSALDLNEVAVSYARSLLGDRVQCGDFMSMHYPDRAFDVVRFSHSLEHMYDLSKVLAEARRILDDHGMLVVTVPNAGSVEAKLFGRWWFPWEIPRHLYHFDQRTITRLLESAGLRVRQIQTGVTAAHFMTSLERVWVHRTGHALPGRQLIEKLVVRPFCLLAGNLGYGTELTVYAMKASSPPGGAG